MSDDRLKDFSLDHKKNETERLSKNSDRDIALDSLGIPILEDVVLHEHNAIPDNKASGGATKISKINLSLPNNEVLVDALRNQLRSQVKDDIENISDKVANIVVSSITPELIQKIKAQITEVLEHNLDNTINCAITDIPED